MDRRAKTRILVGLLGVLAAQPAARGQVAPRGEIVTVVHNPPEKVPSLGPRNAPVTIEFFANLGDGSSSGLVHALLIKLLERHPRRVRVLYRLVTSGEQSNPHLEAALEAFSEGRFREFLDSLYGDTMRSPRVADLPQVAAKAGVDPERVAQALEDGRYAAAVAANHYYQKRQRLRRTPSLLINGLAYDRRPRTLDELESLYDEAYARGMALRDQGVPADQVYPQLLAQIAADQPEPIVGPGAVDGLGPGERPPLGPPPLLGAPLDRGGHHRGPEGAPVTIVFLCNFQTRNCAEAADFLDEITSAYPDEVRLVFRHFFDPNDRRQDRARSLYRAALCAEQQGRFWSFYELGFREALHGTTEPIRPAELARELELDGRAFAGCLRSPQVKAMADTERQIALRAGVRHTPSIILGGRLFTGTKSFDELAALVDRELAPGVLGRIAPE